MTDVTSRDRSVIEAEMLVLRAQRRRLPERSLVGEKVDRTIDELIEEWSACPSSGP